MERCLILLIPFLSICGRHISGAAIFIELLLELMEAGGIKCLLRMRPFVGGFRREVLDLQVLSRLCRRAVLIGLQRLKGSKRRYKDNPASIDLIYAGGFTER